MSGKTKNIFKKIRLTGLGIIGLLLLTNPGMERFKAFGSSKTPLETRVADYFIFSLYERYEKSQDDMVVKATYVGVLLNFFKVSQKDWRTDFR